MKFNRAETLFVVFVVTLFSCTEKQPKTLFTLLPSEQTGVTFSNEILETDSFNILTYEYIYNGGGVGIADFNNDGKQDLFFTGNQVPNRLYLNQGDFKFSDVTATANVNVPGRWNSGVALADVNNDGWMDIYVCATTHPEPERRKNMLFVNQGVGTDGSLRFVEGASQYGLDFNGHSVMAAFLDYDRDEDLDLYILVNEKMPNVPSNYRPKIDDGTAINNDRLFRNNGNGKFEDVTLAAGIVHEGFGLGLAVSDFNKDGWADLYVSNDYISNDVLYLNNHDGTFSNRSTEFIGHQSQFSMGNDAADVNNDLLPDLLTLDMLPEANERKKTTIGNKSYSVYINNEKYGYDHQYVRNMLHINGGLDQGIKFSEIGQMAGVYQTEWSWSVLAVDFDNDGWKDLAVTNGFPKDITDKDFANYRAEIMNIASPGYLVDSIPVIKIPNYAFRNRGDNTFSDESASWGLNQPSFSNGAAFADLDNDGDLDYVVNNINMPAFVYRNTLYDEIKENVVKPNYLRVSLKGSASNISALGAKVSVHYDGGVQYQDYSIYRGYLSSVEGTLHFGLGSVSEIDSVRVQWPDGKISILTDVAVNRVIKVDQAAAKTFVGEQKFDAPKMAENVTASLGIDYKHTEEDVIDFNIQRTIPHKYSQMGPALAVGDINADGLEDFVVGGTSGIGAQSFLQGKEGKFVRKNATPGAPAEDTGILLFDFDNDSDLDLYAVSGNFDPQGTAGSFQDRIYRNDGKGNFTNVPAALPEIKSNGSCVRAADFDRDGDLDLFVGGRVKPAQFPLADLSYLLRNDGAKFTDVTDEVAPGLRTAGMLTDAIWSDFDGDQVPDLIVTGEFMPLSFFGNKRGKLAAVSVGIDSLNGWWNSINGGDFDNDGDTDYIVGNIGHNNHYNISRSTPLRVYGKDFDGNGSMDALMSCYIESLDGNTREYPMHFWDELNQQSPKFRRLFSRYKQFAIAEMNKILSAKDLEGASILETNYQSSSYFENTGHGRFVVKALPLEAQVAPVNGIAVLDMNEDGNLDAVLTGNDFGNEVFIGRHDAFNGLVLLGDGKGGFTPVKAAQSGFYVPGDAKSLVSIRGKKGEMLLASQNRGALLAFSKSTSASIPVESLDVLAVIKLANGSSYRVELYHGAGYLSQSTRSIAVPKGSTEILITNSKGEVRTVAVKPD